MIGGLFFVLIGGFVAAFALWMMRALDRVRRRGAGWPRIEATIESLGQGPHELSPWGTRYPVTLVSYRYPHPSSGEPVRATDLNLGQRGTGPGEPVMIAHDPADPSRSVTVLEGAGVLQLILVVFVGAGSVFVLLGLGSIYRALS